MAFLRGKKEDFGRHRHQPHNVERTKLTPHQSFETPSTNTNDDYITYFELCDAIRYNRWDTSLFIFDRDSSPPIPNNNLGRPLYEAMYVKDQLIQVLVYDKERLVSFKPPVGCKAIMVYASDPSKL